MRQKASNYYFTIFYPARQTGMPLPDNDAPSIFVANSGEHVSINGPRAFGSQPSAVFYDANDLRALAHVLEEVADLFEENQAKTKASKVAFMSQKNVCDVFKYGRCDSCDHPCTEYLENKGYQDRSS